MRHIDFLICTRCENATSPREAEDRLFNTHWCGCGGALFVRVFDDDGVERKAWWPGKEAKVLLGWVP